MIHVVIRQSRTRRRLKGGFGILCADVPCAISRARSCCHFELGLFGVGYRSREKSVICPMRI